MAHTAAARVDLPGGPVTLEPLDRLTAEAGRLAAQAQAELERSNAAIAAAQGRLAQAGALLTDHPDGWDHGPVAAEAAAVAQLKDHGAAVGAELSALSIRDRGGLRGAFHSLLDGHHREELEKKRAALAERLQAALTALADA